MAPGGGDPNVYGSFMNCPINLDFCGADRRRRGTSRFGVASPVRPPVGGPQGKVVGEGCRAEDAEKGDGLQPTTDGLQPNGRPPTGEGLEDAGRSRRSRKPEGMLQTFGRFAWREVKGARSRRLQSSDEFSLHDILPSSG